MWEWITSPCPSVIFGFRDGLMGGNLWFFSESVDAAVDAATAALFRAAEAHRAQHQAGVLVSRNLTSSPLPGKREADQLRSASSG